MFAYCNNNPVKYSDLTGDSPTAAFVIGTLFAVAAIGILSVAAIDASVKLGEEIKTWVATTTDIKEYRGQSVYVLRDPNNNNLVQYVGRTNDPMRRYTEHKNDANHPERQSYSMKVVATGLKEREARLVEQMLISTYTLSYLDNARREIATRKISKYSGYFSSAQNIIKGATEESLRSLLLN